ncbi:hypothetical protein ACXX82_10485 [Glaciimonas sp. GNP009]
MKNIGYSEFIKRFQISDPENWTDGLSVKFDGVYIRPPAPELSLTPEERSISSEHPTHDLTKPALSFPCSLEELRAFDEFLCLGLDLNGVDEDAQQEASSYKPISPAVVWEMHQQEAEQSVVHKIKVRESSILSDEIYEAKKQANNPNSRHHVWNELVKLALVRFGCLLGMDGKDIKYLSGEDVLFFKRRNLNDRMNTAEQRRITTHHDA